MGPIMNFGIIPARYAPYLQSVLRIVAGLSFVEHGTGKILGFPMLSGSIKCRQACCISPAWWS